MPAPTTKDSRPSVAKRQKVDQTRAFTTVEQISAALRSQNQENLVHGKYKSVLDLTALRNQLSIRPGEDAISPQDPRLLLVQRWLENVPGAHDVFTLWDSLAQRQNSLFALIVSLLSALLTLTSSHYTFQALGQPIVKTLLTPTYTRRLNSYLGGTHAELILVTLKLFNVLSSFAGGREKKSVLEAFGWELKSLPKLLNMRRKSKEDGPDALKKPDIRTLYILFILSFISPDAPAQVKATFVEQHRDPFLSIFKGLIQDSYPVARKILEVCWAGLWSDPKIKRTSKINLFNESTISHLLKLYDRNVTEDDDPDHIPADLVHHFLLAICTRPGVGICFKDRGWYPRESDGDEEGRGKIYNRILANVLKSLKVNEDLRHQELALKTMAACPELVAGYWSGAALTLEPRLSSKWIANISFFGSVLSQPVPSSSFYLPGTTLYQPNPPPLSTIIENILPSVNTKVHFTRGLQSSSALVQHCTALALAKCLSKYEHVLSVFREIEGALGENEMDGQWSKRRRDIEREVRRRVPDFQVIVAFSQQKFGDAPVPTGPASSSSAPSAAAPPSPPNPTRAALLAESADRLLWMYQRCLPLAVAEARFDVGKLLHNFATIEGKTEDEEVVAADKWHIVRQLHILRLLKDSEQFGWSGKTGSASQTHLAVLLNAYIRTDIPAIRTALSSLLQHILAGSIMFQDDPAEPYLWLISLPTSRRRQGTESPDGAPLADEGDGVITFLDDCVLRCLKTPYRYIEDLDALENLTDGHSQPRTERVEPLPSPLLMTVLEQLEIKVSKKILSASDVLGLASFVRKLMFRLSSKQQDLGFLRAAFDKFDKMLHIDKLFAEFPGMTHAIRQFTASPAEFLWKGLDIVSRFSEIQQYLSFDFLLLHAADTNIADAACRQILVDAALNSKLNLVQAKRVACLISHRLMGGSVKQTSGLLHLLASILKRASTILPSNHFVELKEAVLAHSNDIKSYLTSGSLPNTVLEGTLHHLVDDVLDPTNVQDRVLIAGTSAHWLEVLTSNSLNDSKQLLLAAPWIKYFRREDLFNLLDTHFLEPLLSASRTSTSLSLVLLESILAAVKTSTKSEFDSEGELVRRLPQLVALYSRTPSTVLEELIALTIQSSLPAYHDGSQCGEALEETSMAEIIKDADLKWSQRRNRWPADLPIRPFLFQDVWTTSTLTIISGLIYRGHLPYDDFLSWCSSGHCTARSSEHFIMCMHAFLDASSCRERELPDDDIWVSLFSRILQTVLDDSLPETVKLQAGDCISLMTCNIPSKTITFLAKLVRAVQTFSVTKVYLSMLSVGRVLHARLPRQSEDLQSELVNHGLQWAIRCSSENEDPLFNHALSDLASLAHSASGIKPHLVETALGVIVQTRLNHPPSLELMIVILPLIHLKPLVVNRHLQSILQHSSFFKYTTATPSTDASSRGPIIRLLHTLFNMHPTNTCQITHVEPLVKIYTGTLSHSDGLILSIFRLFEIERKMSISSLLCRWSSSPSLLSQTSLEAIQSLDPILVLRTCLGFPSWRTLDDLTTTKATSHETQLYDPIFLMLLFSQVLAENAPESAFAWVEVFRTNIASLLIRTLSSKHDTIRDIALCQLAGLWQYLENADLQERPHVLHILSLLKDVYAHPSPASPASSAPSPIRLPTYTTLLLSHSLRAIFYPSNFIYPITARFLLQRPSLDTRDVPMLYTMLYSSTEAWKKERGWMVRFLSDGMMSSTDWRVLKGRHTWDLLASLFQSCENGSGGSSVAGAGAGDDKALRSGIFQILANLTCNAQATTSLILKSGLLSWIEIQLMTHRHQRNSINSGIEWAKILCNILNMASTQLSTSTSSVGVKLETSTQGEWRAAICRCLLLLVDNPDCPTTLPTFPFVTQAALRLSLFPVGTANPNVHITGHMRLLTKKLIGCLKLSEGYLSVPPSSLSCFRASDPEVTNPHLNSSRHRLYTSHTIHSTSTVSSSSATLSGPGSGSDSREPLQEWGINVESLWHRLITSKDHASVQISIADVDANGRALNTSTTFALCGQVRSQGESDDSLNRLATKAGLLRNVWSYQK
ncbi:hypothetical protein H0H92_009090 [Tricholoma furcatifolium]|nr:hypothetical protein H0H92_009090 [Tricholoma furcatifolium]